MKTSFLLGLIGGILGLLMTPLNFILGIVILVLTGTKGPPIILVVAAGALSAIVGIVAAVLSRWRLRLGGAVMLASGLFPLIVALAISISYGVLQLMLPLLALYFWTLLLIIGGTLSLLPRVSGGDATAIPNSS